MHHDPELFERDDAIAIEIEPADHGPALVQVQGQLQLLIRAHQPPEHPLQARRRDALLLLLRRPLAAPVVRVREHPERHPEAPPPAAARVVVVGLLSRTRTHLRHLTWT